MLNNLCLYADSEMNKPLGIATLHEANLRHFLKGKAVAVLLADTTTTISALATVETPASKRASKVAETWEYARMVCSLNQ